MSDASFAPEPTVFVLAACQPPGAAIARSFAQSGMRVVLVDADTKAMTRIAAQNPDQIETLVFQDGTSDMAKVLSHSWGAEPLSMMINLMPLERPGAITEQMRNLTSVMRGMMRGLIAGQGSLVSLVTRPADPLALVGNGMVTAMQSGSSALGAMMQGHGVRVHLITLPKEEPQVAVETLLHLARPEGRLLLSNRIDLG